MYSVTIYRKYFKMKVKTEEEPRARCVWCLDWWWSSLVSCEPHPLVAFNEKHSIWHSIPCNSLQ